MSNNKVTLNISNKNPFELPADSLNSTKFVYSDFMNNAVGYFGAHEIPYEESVLHIR